MKAPGEWRLRPDYRLGASFGAKGSNKAADRGLAYHRKVFKALENHTLEGYDLHIEPWYQEHNTGRFCQPDSVLVSPGLGLALVIEVKLNWADGRADKLLNLYLPATRAAYKVDHAWPLVITQNLRGYQHPPLLGLYSIVDALAWEPGQPVPLMLLP